MAVHRLIRITGVDVCLELSTVVDGDEDRWEVRVTSTDRDECESVGIVLSDQELKALACSALEFVENRDATE